MQAELEQIITEVEAIDRRARYEKVTQIPAQGLTILGKGAEDPEFLTAVLELLPALKRLDAVKAPVNNSDNNSLLYHAADNPESLAVILKVYPIRERLHALTQVIDDDGCPFILMLTTNPDSYMTAMNLLHPDDQLPAAKSVSSDGETVLHAVAFGDAECALCTLNLYQPDHQLEAVKRVTSEGVPVLAFAAEALSKYGIIEPFSTLLSVYPIDERLMATTKADSIGRTILSTNESIINGKDRVEINTPRCLLYKVILSLLPEKHRLDFLDSSVNPVAADDDSIDEVDLTVLEVMIEENFVISAAELGFEESFVPAYLAIRSFLELKPSQRVNKSRLFQADLKIMRLKNDLDFCVTFDEIKRDLKDFVIENKGTFLAKQIQNRLMPSEEDTLIPKIV